VVQPHLWYLDFLVVYLPLLYFLSRLGSDVPVLHPLANATNFYGTDYSGLPVHGGRTIMQ